MEAKTVLDYVENWEGVFMGFPLGVGVYLYFAGSEITGAGLIICSLVLIALRFKRVANKHKEKRKR